MKLFLIERSTEASNRSIVYKDSSSDQISKELVPVRYLNDTKVQLWKEFMLVKKSDRKMSYQSFVGCIENFQIFKERQILDMFYSKYLDCAIQKT